MGGPFLHDSGRGPRGGLRPSRSPTDNYRRTMAGSGAQIALDRPTQAENHPPRTNRRPAPPTPNGSTLSRRTYPAIRTRFGARLRRSRTERMSPQPARRCNYCSEFGTKSAPITSSPPAANPDPADLNPHLEPTGVGDAVGSDTCPGSPADLEVLHRQFRLPSVVPAAARFPEHPAQPPDVADAANLPALSIR